MRFAVIMILCVDITHANNVMDENLSVSCEKAIEKATKIHWDFANDKAGITKDYNARIKAEKICGFKLE